MYMSNEVDAKKIQCCPTEHAARQGLRSLLVGHSLRTVRGSILLFGPLWASLA